MSLPSFLPVYRYVPGLQVTKLDENNSSIVRLQSEPTSSIGTSAYIISKSGVDAVLAKHDRDGQSVREFVIVCIIENIIYYTHMLCMMHIYSLCFSYYILFYTLYHMYMLCYTCIIGYTEAIPNIMASLFPDTRYAGQLCYP